MRPVLIKPVLNGFIVEVGCQTLVFNNIDLLCRELKRYHLEPLRVQKEYLDNGINEAEEARGPEPASRESARNIEMPPTITHFVTTPPPGSGVEGRSR